MLLGLQAFGSGKAAQAALLLAWALPLELLARGVLRERDMRTGELVFTAPRMLGRLLAVRFAVAALLLLALSLPGLLRLFGASPLEALAGLVVVASIASWGMALGAMCRNPRPFELALVCAVYLGLQGAIAVRIRRACAADAAVACGRAAACLGPAGLVLAADGACQSVKKA